MLQYLIQSLTSSLSTAPDGKLHVIRHGGSYQFYLRSSATDTNGHYLNKKELPLIQSLAQKEHDKWLLSRIEGEHDFLNMYLKLYGTDPVKDIYNQLNSGILSQVRPVYLSDEEFIRQWLAVPYEKMGFPADFPEFYTNRGERVRSKSEIIIANTLETLGIPYRYEAPLKLNGRIVYPDFTVLNVRLRMIMYIEHLGMMDDPEYSEKALDKILAYENSGLYVGQKLLIFHETSKKPLDTNLVQAKCKEFLL